MRRNLQILAALAIWVALGAPAAADDIELLNRNSTQPNVMLILDTSQSMRWTIGDGSGFSRGEEYGANKPGFPGTIVWDTDPDFRGQLPARMAMLKRAMARVLDTYATQIRFGLTTYPLGPNATPANPNANVFIEGYHYYKMNGGDRQYRIFNWNDANNVIQIHNDPNNINMPAEPQFTVKWLRDSPPWQEESEFHAAVPPQDWDTCNWEVQQFQPDGVTPIGGPGFESYVTGDPLSCRPVGGISRKSYYRYFDVHVLGDDPAPYKYNFYEAWTIPPPVDGVGLGSGLYGGFTGYLDPTDGDHHPTLQFHTRYTSLGPEHHHIDGTPAYTLWRWHFFYYATCLPERRGCDGPRAFTWDYATGWQSSQFPRPDSWDPGTGSDETNIWTGNNYNFWGLGGDPLSPSCALPGGTRLVNVGPANGPRIKEYLGKGEEGSDPAKEIHGADYGTPLKNVLNYVASYFLNPDGARQGDTDFNCRTNHVILVTDGGESCVIDPITAAGDAALALRTTPVNPRGGVPTYVVAVARPGTPSPDLSPDEDFTVRDVAAKGRVGGQPFWAPTEADLVTALGAIIAEIQGDAYGFTSPVVPTLRRQDNLMLLQASFKTPNPPGGNPPGPDPNTPWWAGELKAFQLNDNGQIVGDPLFQAGVSLAGRTWGSRTILTKSTTSAGIVPFEDPSVDADLRRDDASVDVVALRRIVRGDNGMGFKLGSIMHSNPQPLGPPDAFYVDRTFNGDMTLDVNAPPQLLPLTGEGADTFGPYRDATRTRKRLILVGANDGMLHAFNGGEWNGVTQRHDNMANAGKEEWGFIPTEMLPKLRFLMVNGGHQYYVDCSPKAAHVWLDGLPNDGGLPTPEDGVKASNEWHKVVVGCYRQGGPNLYALDVTDPDNPRFLWSFRTRGESWSEPVFAKVRVQIGGRRVDRFVVFVGGGYSTGSQGSRLYAIDIKTGLRLWTYTTTAPVAATPLVMDVNGDGWADRVYVGTLDGKMLRCNIGAVGQSTSDGDVIPGSAQVTTTRWPCSVFLDAGSNQPIFTSPGALVAPDGKVWIGFGTGRRATPLDTTQAGLLFGVKDSGTTLTFPGDLTDVTTLFTFNPENVSPNGWFIRLRTPGEKTFASTLGYNAQFVFSTYLPEGQSNCNEVGSSALYFVYYRTGGGTTDSAFFGTPWEQRPDSAATSRRIESSGTTTGAVITWGSGSSVIYVGHGAVIDRPDGQGAQIPRATLHWRIVP